MEKIEWSAIKIRDKIFTGKRHNDCIKKAVDYGEPTPIRGRQGFLTSEGRFVTREEAVMIAYRALQIKEKKKTLYSEDLW